VSLYPPQQLEPHPSGLTKDQLDDLEASFSDWQNTINASCAATAVLFLLATHFLLNFCSEALANSDGLSGLHILYQQFIWWFFPGLGAISLSFEIVLQVWSIFVSRKIVNIYAEWAARQPKKTKTGVTYYDSRKVFRWIALILTLPVGILTLLALRMHTTFAEDAMHEYGYAFTAPATYSYSKIRRVSQVDGVLGKHEKFIARPYDVIDFVGGHRWSQDQWDDTTPGITESLDATLLARTNLSFFHFHVL